MNYLISKDYSPETPYYFYKTTNLINGRFYYGSGSKKNYLGSSTELKIDIKKYGKQNFKQEKLRYFKTREDAFDFEFRFLKLIDAKNILECYNLSNFTMCSPEGQVTVKDKNGNMFNVSVDDPRYLSGELISRVTGTLKVKDKEGNIYTVDNDDPRYLSGELVYIATDKIVVKDKDGNISQVDRDEFNKRPDLVGHTKGSVVVKDKLGNSMRVDMNDPRYLSGELVHICTGQITVRDKQGNTFNVDKGDPRYLSGELVSIATGYVTIQDKNGNYIRVERDDPRVKNAIYPTTGMWNWNKFIIFENKKRKVKDIADMFNLKCSQVKEYLENNNLTYREI